MSSLVTSETFDLFVTELIELGAFAMNTDKEMWNMYILNNTNIANSCEIPEIITEDVLKKILLNFWEHDWLLWHPENNYYVKLLTNVLLLLEECQKRLEIEYDFMEKINTYKNTSTHSINKVLESLRASAVSKLKSTEVP